ncbi:glycoside hydrolase family 113 [Aestuariivivens insulae]|uniref:glycoside hydrolase family 113 n=1 Tax=Aestuariivivens insulae TaxID=1621988 RepID=UPI001F5993BB|nr:glycoside hydrolase TIM-barrel-like domain-containing protein [Aestuariivivens insulae]
MKILKGLIVFICVLNQSCTGQPSQKINGVSFVASNDAIDVSHIHPVINVHANYAAIMPFGFIRNLEHPELSFNSERQWFGERKEGVRQYVETFREANIQLMIKPQIWVWHGEFTGHIKMQTEADWKTLETSYAKFILEYAALAQELQVELFCIGTELESFVENRPDYWNDLILEVRKIYKGKLTYAANWNEFEHTPFWDKLDFIGIDAYFPVSHSKTPTVEECLVGWEKHKPSIQNLSREYNKSVLFTEFGYRSVDYSGKVPWESDRQKGLVNLEAQNNTTKALFEMFWEEEWFVGGFVWKWFVNHNHVGGENNTMFTPQNKPVEQIIKQYYKK